MEKRDRDNIPGGQYLTQAKRAERDGIYKKAARFYLIAQGLLSADSDIAAATIGHKRCMEQYRRANNLLSSSLGNGGTYA